MMIRMWLRTLCRLSFVAATTPVLFALAVLTATSADAAAPGHSRVYLNAQSSRPLPADTFVNGRVMRTVVIDGGMVVLGSPPRDSHPAVSHAGAQADARASTTATPGAIDPAGTALASVHIALTVARTAKRPGRQLAWVTVIRPELGVSCLASEGTVEPSFHVLITAASGSSASIYTSKGTGPCGGTIHPPSLTPAFKIESISWRSLSSTALSTSPPKYNWTISYQVPRCASVFDSPGIYFLGPGVPVLYVQVRTPVISSRRCAEGRASNTVIGPEDVPVTAARHAPLGVHQF